MKRTNVVLAFLTLSFSLALIFGLEGTPTVSYEEGNLSNNLSISSFKDTHLLEWNFTWGGNYHENVLAMTTDSLGDIYITGLTKFTSPADWDIYLVKFNSTGHLQWNQTWGGNELERFYEIAFDSFNNIYLGGSIEYRGPPKSRFLLVKFNSLGLYQWNQTWGGSNYDIGHGMAVDSADNIYLMGSTTINSDLRLVKFNSLGQYQWNRTWGGNYFDSGHDIVIDTSDNIYITGSYGSTDGADVFLIKYNNMGHFQWNRTYNSNNVQYKVAIALDSLSNIYIGTWVMNISTLDSVMLFLKYDQTGDLLWDRIWGKKGKYTIVDIALDSYNNIYAVGGFNNSVEKGWDFSLIQFDTSGVQQFNQTWGGPNRDFYSAIAIDLTDNIYLAGMNDGSNIYLEKYSRDIITQKGQPSDETIPFENIFTTFIVFSVVILIIVDLKSKKLIK
ncbi:hypothetical protein LCGC14_1550330 [marine sediment metagenome]|uniref:Bulb-type lectin domain-containing protein n=1 Tax=marine sediment metagenome TaxID=412755 RepID=A0A0F9JBH3_9ZZZZ|nr:MAG: Beta-propeller repeat protein [Candidatus Lokiarchaeum sp. GC14_75]